MPVIYSGRPRRALWRRGAERGRLPGPPARSRRRGDRVAREPSYVHAETIARSAILESPPCERTPPDHLERVAPHGGADRNTSPPVSCMMTFRRPPRGGADRNFQLQASARRTSVAPGARIETRPSSSHIRILRPTSKLTRGSQDRSNVYCLLKLRLPPSARPSSSRRRHSLYSR